MNKKFNLSLIIALILFLTACAKVDKVKETHKDKLLIVSSFSIITDMVKEIGQDKVKVYNLVPSGVNPYSYEFTNEDIIKGYEADIFIYNGLNLEGGEDGWLFRYFNEVEARPDNIYDANLGIEPLYVAENGPRKEVNPHTFLDPNYGEIIADNIKNALISSDPSNSAYYEENAELYILKIKEIAKEYGEKIGEIPPEERILVTSKQSFQYLANSYDMTEGFLWEYESEENGNPMQINQLIDFIEYYNPKILFLESNVSTEYMEAVSKATGIEIYPNKLYSEELNPNDSDVDSYLKLLSYNIKNIYNGLK